MATIHNYYGEPIQVRLLNGKFADLPPKKCPLTISEKQPMRRIITLLDDDNELILHGSSVSIAGDNGFPPIRPDVYYIVTKEIVNALRKIGRGAADLLIPVKTKAGYYELRFANIITELSEDDATLRFVRQTLLNSLPQTEVVKYDSLVQEVSQR
ncbi:hypothetical protein IKG64_02965 [Candidatus Saccharibacteria bacterium]|nr:hypothetical protein [Candidatus Saccharibacteria bacterium]